MIKKFFKKLKNFSFSSMKIYLDNELKIDRLMFVNLDSFHITIFKFIIRRVKWHEYT